MNNSLIETFIIRLDDSRGMIRFVQITQGCLKFKKVISMSEMIVSATEKTIEI